jgi:RND family efflux transporter MFP subunit
MNALLPLNVEDKEQQAESDRGNRAGVVAVMAIVLVVLTVIVILMVQQAPMVGSRGPEVPGGPSQMPPAAVIVASVQAENTQKQAIVTGSLRASSKIAVAAQEAGAVVKMLIDEGDEIQPGATLAILDARRIKAQLDEANARLTMASNLLEQRQAEHVRAEVDLRMKVGLTASKAVSQSDLLDAKKNLKVAALQVKSAADGISEAQSRVELLDVQLSDLTVKAPLPGVVVSRNVEPGEWVAAGSSVATIVTMDPMEAWLRVPARHLDTAGKELEGFKVRQSATGQTFTPAKVILVPEVNDRSQLFTLVATVPNPDRKLSPGESVTGIVPIGKPAEHLRVPLNAVVYSAHGTVIYVVQKPLIDDALPTARPVSARIAFARNGSAFIVADNAGFSADDRVVVEGNQRLLPGQSLMIKTSDHQGGLPTP